MTRSPHTSPDRHHDHPHYHHHHVGGTIVSSAMLYGPIPTYQSRAGDKQADRPTHKPTFPFRKQDIFFSMYLLHPYFHLGFVFLWSFLYCLHTSAQGASFLFSSHTPSSSSCLCLLRLYLSSICACICNFAMLWVCLYMKCSKLPLRAQRNPPRALCLQLFPSCSQVLVLFDAVLYFIVFQYEQQYFAFFLPLFFLNCSPN